MTDEMRAREKAICEAANVNDIGEVSDGFHTFNSLYEQRMILFATLVKVFNDKAWKSYRHEDGDRCFGGGWFIVGIDTPEGSYTYHYENKYWDMFDCAILPRAKHWDGHTEKDVTRLLSLSSAQPKWIPASENATDRIEIVMEFATAKKKMELAEKYLELDKKVARLDDSIRQIGNDKKTKTGSMVITCDCVMPFVDIEVEDVKSMLRNYRDNLRIKMDSLWKEFSTIDLGKEAKQ